MTDPLFELMQNITMTYALYNTMVISLILIVPRMSMKRYIALTLSVMGVFYALNMAAAFVWGINAVSRFYFFTISIPSFIYFFAAAKYRDGRTIFAFCFGDMTILSLFFVCGMISALCGFNPWVLLFVRLLIFPIAEFFMAKYLRNFYLTVSNEDKGGWWLIAAVAAGFYIMLMVLGSTPTLIITRRGDWLVYICIIIAMVLTFAIVFKTLSTQLKIIRHERTEHFMEIQIRSFENTIRTMKQNDEKLRIIRHDIRHYENTLRSLAKCGDIEEIKKFILNTAEIVHIEEPQMFSQSPLLNSLLSFYIEDAKNACCYVETKFSLSSPLPVNDVEICIVFANAIENAINAAKKIPEPSKRKIKITCIENPQFALAVANTFSGTVKFDENGLPVSERYGHGYGTQSLLTFAARHNAFLSYAAEDGWFRVRMLLAAKTVAARQK